VPSLDRWGEREEAASAADQQVLPRRGPGRRRGPLRGAGGGGPDRRRVGGRSLRHGRRRRPSFAVGPVLRPRPGLQQSPLGARGRRRPPVEPGGRRTPGGIDPRRPAGRGPPPQHLPPPQPVAPAGPGAPPDPGRHDAARPAAALPGHPHAEGRPGVRALPRRPLPPGRPRPLREGVPRRVAPGRRGDRPPALAGPVHAARDDLSLPQPLLPRQVRPVGLPGGQARAPAQFRGSGFLAPGPAAVRRRARRLRLLRPHLAGKGIAHPAGRPGPVGTGTRRRLHRPAAPAVAHRRGRAVSGESAGAGGAVGVGDGGGVGGAGSGRTAG